MTQAFKSHADVEGELQSPVFSAVQGAAAGFIAVSPIDTPGPIGGAGKRGFDFLIAVLAIVALAPFMLAIAAVIRLTMGGPVFYSQVRIGYDGQLFRCYKFRSMRHDAEEVLRQYLDRDRRAASEWHSTQKLRNDPRVTRFGSLLRRSSADELPQLFNILLGEMSCVGPRPVVPEELARYGSVAVEYLRARPGLTGLWQVSGRNAVSYAERVSLDRAYVQNWSLRKDLEILVRTVPAVLSARGSC